MVTEIVNKEIYGKMNELNSDILWLVWYKTYSPKNTKRRPTSCVCAKKKLLLLKIELWQEILLEKYLD